MKRNTNFLVGLFLVIAICGVYALQVYEILNDKASQAIQFFAGMFSVYWATKTQGAAAKEAVLLNIEMANKKEKEQRFRRVEVLQRSCQNMVFGMQEYCGGQFNDVVYKFYDAEEFGDMLVEFNKIQKHEIKESHIHVFNQYKDSVSSYFYEVEKYFVAKKKFEKNRVGDTSILGYQITEINEHKLCSFVMSCYFKRMKFLYGKLTQDMFL